MEEIVERDVPFSRTVAMVHTQEFARVGGTHRIAW